MTPVVFHFTEVATRIFLAHIRTECDAATKQISCKMENFTARYERIYRFFQSFSDFCSRPTFMLI